MRKGEATTAATQQDTTLKIALIRLRGHCSFPDDDGSSMQRAIDRRAILVKVHTYEPVLCIVSAEQRDIYICVCVYIHASRLCPRCPRAFSATSLGRVSACRSAFTSFVPLPLPFLYLCFRVTRCARHVHLSSTYLYICTRVYVCTYTHTSRHLTLGSVGSRLLPASPKITFRYVPTLSREPAADERSR